MAVASPGIVWRYAAWCSCVVGRGVVRYYRDRARHTMSREMTFAMDSCLGTQRCGAGEAAACTLTSWQMGNRG